MARTNVYLESKPRYEILDGLRGIAALFFYTGNAVPLTQNIEPWKFLLCSSGDFFLSLQSA